MRVKLTVMLVALSLLIALSTAEQVAVRRVTDAALLQADEITERIRSREMQEALKKTHALDEAWDEKAKLLEILVDHGSTDDVRYALSRLIAAIESGDASAAMIYAGELEGGVEHVLERQQLTLENLF